MAFRYQLSSVEFWLIFAAFVLFMIFLMWFVPGYKRDFEKQKDPLLSLRALVITGPGYVIGGGMFYRLTLYKDYLAVVLFLSQKIKFQDIKVVSFKDSCLVVTLHGVKTRIFGDYAKLNQLHVALKSR